MRRIMRATVWPNGLVTTFDWAGEEIVELQGPADEVGAAILKRADAHTLLEYGIDFRDDSARPLSRQEFEAYTQQRIERGIA